MSFTLTFDSVSKPSILRALPPGITFNPSESDLVAYYLCGKISGKLNLLDEAFVQTYDIYGEQDPWEIWERLGGEDDGALHLFTNLKKKSVNGKRRVRTVGVNGGTWHGEGPNKPSQLEFEGKMVTWQRRRFNYKNPTSPHHHGCWTMLEYSCCLSPDLVVVVLKRNKPCVDDDGKRKNPCVDTTPAVATQKTQSKKRKLCDISSSLDDHGKQENADQSESSGVGIWENQVAAANISNRFDDEFSAESLASILLSFDGSDSLVHFDYASITEHRSTARATDDGSIEGLDMLNDGFSNQSFTNMMDSAKGFDSAMVTGSTIVDGSGQEAYDGRSFGKWITVEAGYSDWAY